MTTGGKIGLGVISILAIGLVGWKASEKSKAKSFDKKCLAGGNVVALSGKECKTYSTTDQTADIYQGDIEFR
jgi:hypothetical protein